MVTIQKVIAKISYYADKVSQVMTILSLLFFFVAIFGGVLLRFVFKLPNSAMEDLTRTGFVWACFFAAAVAYKSMTLIRFRFFQEKFSENGQLVISIISDLLALSLALFLIVYGLQLTLQVWPSWQIGARISKGYMYMALPISMVFMTIHSVNFIFTDLCALCSKEVK